MSAARYPFAPTWTVLLVADPPTTPGDQAGDFPRDREPDSPMLVREALISLARAVFAAGGQLVLPADGEVASLIGTVALGYIELPPAESPPREGEPVPPVTVMETRPGQGSQLSSLLAPLSIRGGLQITDVDGRVIPPRPAESPEEPTFEPIPRHPITERMLDQAQPSLAVFLNPRPAALEERILLRDRDIRVAVFTGSIQDPSGLPQFAADDPTARLLDGEPDSPWSAAPEDSRARPPYAYLMQRLVAEVSDQN